MHCTCHAHQAGAPIRKGGVPLGIDQCRGCERTARLGAYCGLQCDTIDVPIISAQPPTEERGEGEACDLADGNARRERQERGMERVVAPLVALVDVADGIRLPGTQREDDIRVIPTARAAPEVVAARRNRNLQGLQRLAGSSLWDCHRDTEGMGLPGKPDDRNPNLCSKRLVHDERGLTGIITVRPVGCDLQGAHTGSRIVKRHSRGRVQADTAADISHLALVVLRCKVIRGVHDSPRNGFVQPAESCWISDRLDHFV
ncbi:MAG: hypothetical protein ACJ8BW_29900 [Ktedonobacteraceae bacterium]